MPCSNDVDARPYSDTGVGVPATLGAGGMPVLEPIGDAVGRVLTRRAADGRITDTLSGEGVLANSSLLHFGSFTYAGDPKCFTGELALTFARGPGTKVLFRGTCVGRHVGSGLAVIQSVGTFEPGDSMLLVGQITVAEITVAKRSTYQARFYRLVPARSAQAADARVRAFDSGVAVP